MILDFLSLLERLQHVLLLPCYVEIYGVGECGVRGCRVGVYCVES